MNFSGLRNTGFKYLGRGVRLPWFPSLILFPDKGYPALSKPWVSYQQNESNCSTYFMELL